MPHPVSPDTLTTVGKRLRYVRSLLRMTRSYLHEKYQLPEVTLKSWESGTVKLTPEGLQRCLSIYRQEGLVVGESWIMDGTGLPPTATITLGNYFKHPTHIPSDIADDEILMLKEAQQFKQTYSNAVILVVSNDEMRPYYKPGDYVGGRLREGQQILSAINKNCIVYLKNGTQYLKRLVHTASGGFNLTCLNPTELTAEPVLFNVDIVGAAPVIWHRCKDD